MKKKILHLRDIGEVLLQRSSRAKRLIITVRPLHGVRIAVPEGVSFAAAEQLVLTRASWIKTQVLRLKKTEAACRIARDRAAAIDRRAAKRILSARVAHIAGLHGYTFNRITVRSQQTRWGSCSGADNISLNVKLLLLPDELRDYIILHELVHTRVKNHGPDFWDELLKVEPKARKLAAEIGRYCLELV